MPVENVFLGRPETMTDPLSLFNALKALCYNHCIVGCSIDHELLLNDQVDRDKMYRRAESKGLQPRHVYSVLDVRRVTQKHASGQVEHIDLVRLQNPWADAQEWEGKFCDRDPFWEDEAKKQEFNNYYFKVGVEADNARYLHGWGFDDGIFAMRVADFLDYFTQMTVCRPFGGGVFGVEYEQQWKLTDSFMATSLNPIKQDRQYVFT